MYVNIFISIRSIGPNIVLVHDVLLKIKRLQFKYIFT